MATRTVIEEDGSIKGFNDWIKADGSTEHQPEAGRYHIYGQHLCPYSNRATIGRVLKGLENIISYDNVDWLLLEGKGWKFNPEREGCDSDSVNGYEYLRDAYDATAKKLGAPAGYVGMVTVPTLYDKKLQRVVSNDSASILKMFNSEFQEFCSSPEHRDLDLYPEELREKVDEVEEWTNKQIITAIYYPVAAKNQKDYDAAIENLYSGLDKLEGVLSKSRYVTGSTLTEADIRLFCVLIRFDPVYALLFCTKKRVVDYPAIWAYTRDVYQTGNVRATINRDQTIKGYFLSYRRKLTNPHGIVPALPDLNYEEPHNRANLTASA